MKGMETFSIDDRLSTRGHRSESQVGSITSRCSGKESAGQTRESGGNRA